MSLESFAPLGQDDPVGLPMLAAQPSRPSRRSR